MKRILAGLCAWLLVMTPVLAQNAPPTPAPTSVVAGQVALSVTTSSARVALPSAADSAGAITIYNKGTADAYYALGSSSVTATTASIQIPASTFVTVWRGTSTFLAAITASSSTSLVIYQANGPIQFGMVGGSGGGGGSGTVTEVDTGSCLTGGPITTSGTVSVTALVNVQTVDYTLLATDACKHLFLTKASTFNFSLPEAGSAGFPSGFEFDVENTGVGNVIATALAGTINGSASAITIPQYSFCTFTSDGVSDWKVSTCLAIAPAVGSVAASGGIATVSGSPITQTGTVHLNSVINAQTGSTYTIADADRGNLTTYSNAGAIAVTLPQAGTAGAFPAGWIGYETNIGSTTVAITPAGGSKINGSVSAYNLNPGAGNGVILISTGTDYIALAGNLTGSGCATSGCTFTGAITMPAGSATAPSIIVAGTQTGLYSAGTNIGCWTSAGVVEGCISSVGRWNFGPKTSAATISNGTATPRSETLDNSATADQNSHAILSYRASASLPAVLAGGLSKSNSIGANVTVAANDNLFEVQAQGNDGTNFQKAAKIEFDADNTVSAGVVPGRVTIATANAAGTMTNAMRVDSAQHIIAMGGAPTCTTCGGSGTVAGNDNVGRVTEGTSPGTTVVLTFATAWVTNAPVCRAVDENSGVPGNVTTVSTTAVTFTFSALTNADKVSYECRGFQ